MDLTKVTLPTFILERRSLLEMYADFFAHPEDFIHANELETAEDRFVSVVRYYLNAFYPARKSGVAKSGHATAFSAPAHAAPCRTVQSDSRRDFPLPLDGSRAAAQRRQD